MSQRVIIMHGFEYAEIDLIMRAVKKEVESPRDVIFAKSTENSLKMKLADLIEDLAEDHEYLKNNPPPIAKAQSQDLEQTRDLEQTQETDQSEAGS